jgi:4-hydroxybenzoyl-CoA thioesterase
MPERASHHRVRVEFGDCDPAQIAYYPNLVAWVDRSTHHMFEAAGVPVRGLQLTRGLQVPVVGLNVKFFGPAVWGDEIDIKSRIARWGSSSFEVVHHLINAETGARIADASETRVCVKVDPSEPKNLAGHRIPDDVKAAFGPIADSQQRPTFSPPTEPN